MTIITGFSFFGTDIYVHKDNLDAAVELLEAFDRANGENTDAENAECGDETEEND